jgi:hypothetical protein
MSVLIDTIYVARELMRLTYVVITSPFGLMAGLLMLGSYNV